jgi:hypothetical protein
VFFCTVGGFSHADNADSKRWSQINFYFLILRLSRLNQRYTVAGKAIGFALEQPLHVVTLACPASGILKQLEYICVLI